MAFFQEHMKNCYVTTYSEKGYKIERKATIDITKDIKFTFANQTIPIVSRTRFYDSRVMLEKKGHGDSWETWLVNQHSNNFTEGVHIDAYAGHIKDNFQETRGTIYYIDLLNNICAYSIVEINISLISDIVELPLSAPNGTNLVNDSRYWHFLKFPKCIYTKTKTVKEYINHDGNILTVSDVILEDTRYPMNMAVDFTGGFIPDIRMESELKDYYLWEAYKVDNQDNLNPDGYDFFRPSWLPVDELDAWDALTFKDLFSVSGVINYTKETTDLPLTTITNSALDGSPRGSWAVDILGNLFSSQMTIDGKTYNYLTDGNLEELKPATAYFPIAPI